MKVSELGEFKLIDLLSEIVSRGVADPRILIGPGDDAAAWRVGDATLLATTDTMVQGVHFTAESPWKEVGWKALASNLSDIAAMGGVPQYTLVSLCLPGDTEVDDVVQLCQGMMEVADRFQVAVIGGNISSAPVAVVTLTVIGQAQPEGILTRSGAAPGDLVAVTGYLGSSAAGLKMLTDHLQFTPQTTAFLRKAHLQPWPRIAEGQLLAQQGVRAAIDISDGLMADLGHLCKASRVGAVVKADAIPIHPEVRAAFPQECLGFALAGGEDYELLFTASDEVIGRVKAAMERSEHAADCPVTLIGEITRAGGVSVVDKEGEPLVAGGKGWDHFKKGG
ncbi:MAG: thiamine-phosphate kinase [Chloroflexi bacterium]|nr:thiamine-phosphate kinase [Chloroflexota bacterium]